MSVKKRVGIFLGTVFPAAWICYGAAWLTGQHYGGSVFSTVTMVMAFLPTLAMLLCRKLGDEGYDLNDAYIGLHLRGNILRYLFAYLSPVLFVFLACALFFACFPSSMDLQANALLGGLEETGMTHERALNALYSQMLVTVIMGPWINVLTCLGEDLGFRGYLLPKLRGMFSCNAGLKSALVSSALWSVWYLPLYADGYLYGVGYPGAPWLGFLLGFAFHFLLGIFLSYLTLKTGSVIPGALFRSSLTALSLTGVYFTQGETLLILGPSVYGLFGCLVLLAAAVVSVILILREDQAGTLCWNPKTGKKRKTAQ